MTNLTSPKRNVSLHTFLRTGEHLCFVLIKREAGSSLREGQGGGGGFFTRNAMTRQLASKKGATLNGVKDLFHFNTDWLRGAPALG